MRASCGGCTAARSRLLGRPACGHGGGADARNSSLRNETPDGRHDPPRVPALTAPTASPTMVTRLRLPKDAAMLLRFQERAVTWSRRRRCSTVDRPARPGRLSQEIPAGEPRGVGYHPKVGALGRRSAGVRGLLAAPSHREIQPATAEAAARRGAGEGGAVADPHRTFITSAHAAVLRGNLDASQIFYSLPPEASRSLPGAMAGGAPSVT